MYHRNRDHQLSGPERSRRIFRDTAKRSKMIAWRGSSANMHFGVEPILLRGSAALHRSSSGIWYVSRSCTGNQTCFCTAASIDSIGGSDTKYFPTTAASESSNQDCGRSRSTPEHSRDDIDALRTRSLNVHRAASAADQMLTSPRHPDEDDFRAMFEHSSRR